MPHDAPRRAASQGVGDAGPRVLLLAESAVDFAFHFACAVARTCPTMLIAPDRLYSVYRDETPPGLEAPVVHWPRPRSLRNAAFLGELHRRIRRWRPDIIHVLSQSMTWPALVLLLTRDVPLVESVHDVAPHPGDTESARTPEVFHRLLRGLADEMFVLSEHLRAPAAGRFGLPLDRVHTVPSIALTRYAGLAAKQPARAPDGRFDVLFFGRVFLYKGLGHLIFAAESLADRIPNLRITVAGAGTDLPRCRALIRKPELFDIRDRFIPGEETAELFARTDVVALPHVEASQSGLSAIATVMGKPMVATDVGDFRESLGGPVPCALIVPPADPNALAIAIARLHDDPELRAALGRAGLAQAAGPRSPAAIGAQATEIYRSVIARRRVAG